MNKPKQKLAVSAQQIPIDPAQARQKLDCLTRYREALEKIVNIKLNYNGSDFCEIEEAKNIAKQALQETQRKG